MRKIKLLFILFILFLSISTIISSVDASGSKPAPPVITNNYPIVLVHGFAGWSRDEMLGLPYWGLFSGDIQEKLKSAGYKVYTAVVGPISSNWDRACELYAQIKGGTVDYGAAHSSKHGHLRFGRTFPGLYPQWSSSNPIHIIAHSQGGQTSRLLIQLLEEGSVSHIDAEQRNQGDSALFVKKEKGMVCSLTTLATPHDGTTLTNVVNNLSNALDVNLLNLIGAVEALIGQSITENLYDLKLDQWGITKANIRNFIRGDYKGKVGGYNGQDFSIYDLGPVGATELNKWVKTFPSIYYISYATEATTNVWSTTLDPFNLVKDTYVAEVTMFAPFIPFAAGMGCYGPSTWWQSDGVVNTCSAKGPTGHTVVSCDSIKNAQKGRWNYIALLESIDHADVIGGVGLAAVGLQNIQGKNVIDWYKDLAKQLNELPK